ncbi:hypothetical protein A2V47_00980, partial [Candidatus Atribacteria bacterium RBG_19FT_COMBO_35_14]
KKQEEVTFRFYQVPKALFKNPIYKGLSMGAKLMYSILRDRLDVSIKNEWEDEKGYIYLVFSLKELLNLLEIDEKTVIKYKKALVKYNLIFDKRVGQGNPNRIYVLKPEIGNFQNWRISSSRTGKKSLLELEKSPPNDTNVNDPNINNVNRTSREEVVENSRGEIKERIVENGDDINDIRRKIKESLKDKRKGSFIEPIDSGKEKNIYEKSKYSNSSVIEEYHRPKRYRSREKELLAKEIAEELNDNHSLGAFRAVAYKIPEQKIRIFLSIIKDACLTGKIKKSRGAMFISIAKAYAGKNNINLNFR